ncbi:MAG: ferrous iron transport protein B [Planctomycetota bacterium]|nr:ferrous iron transport protein B [Planctomycetota bacterium]
MTQTQEPEIAPPAVGRPVLLVGQPNVGKSALFGALTGRHATVSNYPGTTVTVSRGSFAVGPDLRLELIDTPGAYSLMPVTDEERVARNAMFQTPAAAVLHVVEATNLDRALVNTLEMLAAGLPVVLVLNMWDEAAKSGVQIDTHLLSERLGCPVLQTVAVSGEGLQDLCAAVLSVLDRPEPVDVGRLWVDEFGSVIDEQAASIQGSSEFPPAMPPRIAAALALRGSRDITESSGLSSEAIGAARREVSAQLANLPPVAAILALRQRSKKVLDGVFYRRSRPSETARHKFGLLLAHPVWGLPFLAAVLYFGFYQLVGVYAAGDLVELLEGTVFGEWVMPPITEFVEGVIPWPWLNSLFVGDYGVLTLGITYALALVLPVVGAFFILFSLVEDSGYFPRLALLCDRLFKTVGLNGRAVITMVLGLGCSTMAVVTTRTLENKRDRMIATLLLVLTIPCSAQLGLITALLASKSFTLWVWYVGCLLAMFVVVGFLAARVFPGRNATFHMELVPMRWPRLGNVIRKTWQRLYWYFREVVPLFALASVVLWLLDMPSSTVFGFVGASQTEAASCLTWIQRGMEPVMSFIGQPIEAAESFLIGFFRRDFGGAGLYKLAQDGEVALTHRQILAGAFTLTLFVPCIATFMMMWKERGARLALMIFATVTVVALIAGAGLNQLLLGIGWR